MDTDTKVRLITELADEYAQCTRCKLCETRTKVVFGGKNVNAPIIIVGEAPGEEEDRQGIPFVGKSGELLNKFLDSFDVTRDDVFLVNIVGCRPMVGDKNRKPAAEEMRACRDRLHRIVEIVDPYVLLLLGSTAVKELTRDKRSISVLAKDPFHVPVTAYTQGQCIEVGRPAIATFHPSYLLRKPGMHEGSDMHLAYQAWEKAFRLVDTYRNIYDGVPVPDRE